MADGPVLRGVFGLLQLQGGLVSFGIGLGKLVAACFDLIGWLDIADRRRRRIRIHVRHYCSLFLDIRSLAWLLLLARPTALD